MQPFDRIEDPVKLRGLVQAMLILEGEFSLAVVLRRLVEEACKLVDARYGALGVLSADRTKLDQFLTVGLDEEEELAIGPRPTGLGVLGSIVVDPTPARLRDLSQSPDSCGVPEHHPKMSSFLGVPVRVRGEVFANLYLTNKNTAEEFSEDDEGIAMALSLAAGAAIENAQLHAAMRDRTLTEDRDRIARDLHDSIIQRLFVVGLSLQGTARLIDNPEVANRISDAINKLDEAIRQLRTAIFDLEVTIKQDGFQRKVYDLMLELAPVVGSHPQATFSGVVDASIPGPIADHALATLREALTNVGKHAGASQVVVTVSVGDDLRLVVADNGRGMAGGSAGGLGLKNLASRAERLGGNLELGTSREGGTRLSWSVPLRPTTTEP